MSKQTINVGTTANDGTGDTLRTAFQKSNANFDELYVANDDQAATNDALTAAITAAAAAAAAAQADADAANAAVTAEATARANADTAEATARDSAIATAVSAEATARAAAVTAEATARANADAALDARITALEVPRTRVAFVAVDSASLGASYADVPDLTFSVETNTTYQFDFSIEATSDATTTGIDIAVTGPAGCVVHYSQGRYSSTTGYLESKGDAFDNDTASTSSMGPTARIFNCRGILVVGSTAGNLKCRMKRENVGTGPVVKGGSWGRITKLF